MSRGRATRLGRFEAAAAILLAATTPVSAVDLGDCCADLEARIAELEATTARKGNRTLSVEISGTINNAILSWYDGVEHNAYVVTNDNDRSRFRFAGKALISSDVELGFHIDLGIRSANSLFVD